MKKSIILSVAATMFAICTYAQNCKNCPVKNKAKCEQRCNDCPKKCDRTVCPYKCDNKCCQPENCKKANGKCPKACRKNCPTINKSKCPRYGKAKATQK